MEDQTLSTAELAERQGYGGRHGRGGVPSAEPDVLLDVPQLRVEEIILEVENLRAHVSVQADVLNLLRLSVGADVQLGGVHLEIKGVEAQALLKVRLDKVAEIINRVLATIDRNPEIIGQIVGPLGAAASELEGTVGRSVDEVVGAVASAAPDLDRSIADVTREPDERAARPPRNRLSRNRSLRPRPPKPTKGRSGICGADGGGSPTPRRRLPEGRRRHPPQTHRTLSSSPRLRPKTFDSKRCRGPRSTSAVHQTMSPPRRTGAGIFPIGSRRTSTITTCVSTTCSQIGSGTAPVPETAADRRFQHVATTLIRTRHEEAGPYLQVAARFSRHRYRATPPGRSSRAHVITAAHPGYPGSVDPPRGRGPAYSTRPR